MLDFIPLYIFIKTFKHLPFILLQINFCHNATLQTLSNPDSKSTIQFLFHFKNSNRLYNTKMLSTVWYCFLNPALA